MFNPKITPLPHIELSVYDGVSLMPHLVEQFQKKVGVPLTVPEKGFDLELECMAARARLRVSIEANAMYELMQHRKKFQKPIPFDELPNVAKRMIEQRNKRTVKN